MRAGTPPNVIVRTARFLLANKHKITGEVRFKARYAVGGHRDRLKPFLRHGLQTLQLIRTRVLLTVAAKLNFKISSTDEGLAYLQSDSLLQFKIYIKVSTIEFNIEGDMTPQYTNSLRGLSILKKVWKFPESSSTLNPSFFIEKLKI